MCTLRRLVPIGIAIGIVVSNTVTAALESNSTFFSEKLKKLEAASGGRIGVSALHTESHVHLQYRAEERFPFCSVFKLFLAAAVLKKSVNEPHMLQELIKYGPKDVEKGKYSPVTRKYIKQGMTVSQLCEAAIQYSDNTAANLLMKKIGGPKAVTDFLRSLGDSAFRLDRWEPELNSALPSDARDTSTPAAMEKSLQKILLGNVLGLKQQRQLQAWLKVNASGAARIRAGVPTNWEVGDKTAACSYGTTNDIGIVWPPKSAPIIVAIFFTQKDRNAPARDSVIATATQILVDAMRVGNP